jgi:hypothetical protein
MRSYHLFEIEADEKPILVAGDYEGNKNLTSDVKASKNKDIVAYGEIEQNKYIPLYEM